VGGRRQRSGDYPSLLDTAHTAGIGPETSGTLAIHTLDALGGSLASALGTGKFNQCLQSLGQARCHEHFDRLHSVPGERRLACADDDRKRSS